MVLNPITAFSKRWKKDSESLLTSTRADYVESMKEAKVAMRKLVSSGSPFEPRIGFSRAVRVGQIVAVSGTAPIAADGIVACPGDVYGHTRRCLEIIADAVVDADLSSNPAARTASMFTPSCHVERPARPTG